MLKRINWKLVFKSFAWVICLAGLVVLMGFVDLKKQTVKCSNVKILIPGADNFIEREEIDAILKQSQGTLIGRNLEQINLNQIEDKIKANPYIALAKIYADMDGVIHIEIKQRQPVLRVINASNQDFYIDRNGLKMPVSSNFTANVLVANGNIGEHFGGKLDTLKSKLATDLYKTALFLKSDTLWDAQIEQIFVNDKKDIELIPRLGNQRIILGDADSLEVKMRNLRAFYKEAMPKVGWDTYKTINIKYTNQVVCERTKPDSVKANAFKPLIIKDPRISGGNKAVDSMVKNEIIKDIMSDTEVTPEIKPKPAEVKKKPAVPEKKPATATAKPAAKEKVKTDTRKNK